MRYVSDSGTVGYYTPDGKPMRKAFLRAPVEFTRVSSVFDPHRLHPILNLIRGHMGTDYAAPIGTPVHAAGDGRVSFEGVRGGYGNAVVLSHSNDISTLYGHLSRFARGDSCRLTRAARRGHRVRRHDRPRDGASSALRIPEEWRTHGPADGEAARRGPVGRRCHGQVPDADRGSTSRACPRRRTVRRRLRKSNWQTRVPLQPLQTPVRLRRSRHRPMRRVRPATPNAARPSASARRRAPQRAAGLPYPPFRRAFPPREWLSSWANRAAPSTRAILCPTAQGSPYLGARGAPVLGGIYRANMNGPPYPPSTSAYGFHGTIAAEASNSRT